MSSIERPFKFNGTISEIEEEEEEEEEGHSSELFEISNVVTLGTNVKEEFDQGSLFSFDFQNGDDVVYVAVGKIDTSMDALVWTLNHAVNPTTLVYLIHVFPETHHIPTPLGKLPIAAVNPEQKESYMVQERSKRREFLEKFLQKCSVSQVKVDTILIESDGEAKAILDLIPILNIRKLVLGTSKSNLRKLRSRRSGGGVADQILQSAPEFCEVKIICEGKEMADHQIMSESSSLSTSPRGIKDSPKPIPEQLDQTNNSIMCTCFKTKVME